MHERVARPFEEKVFHVLNLDTNHYYLSLSLSKRGHLDNIRGLLGFIKQIVTTVKVGNNGFQDTTSAVIPIKRLLSDNDKRDDVLRYLIHQYLFETCDLKSTDRRSKYLFQVRLLCSNPDGGLIDLGTVLNWTENNLDQYHKSISTLNQGVNFLEWVSIHPSLAKVNKI